MEELLISFLSLSHTHTHTHTHTDDGNAIQDYLLSVTGGRSVPRVFIGQKFIGGGSEIKAFNESGKLTTMLKEAGAL